MTAQFTLTLDTTPPADPGLLVNGGAASTGSTTVLLTISTDDYLSGARDVAQMKIWGDVDPTADMAVQATEDGSSWTTYNVSKVIRLASGSGAKRIYARLKDDVCNETVTFTTTITLDTSIPVVSIVVPVDRARISKVAPCNRAMFVWSADREFVAYEVRVVPTEGSPHGAGVPVPMSTGSANTQGVGTFPGDTPITTVIDGTDLETASPGDTAKIIKVFVRDSTGKWSS